MQEVYSLRQPKLSQELIESFERLSADHQVFCFHGDLGSGKTTIIKMLCTHFGVIDGMSSPSFAIVNPYITSGNKTIFHFDLYRLRNEEELIDIGWYDYLNSESLIFVEWPEKGERYVPDDAVRIQIEVHPDDHSRSITITYQP